MLLVHIWIPWIHIHDPWNHMESIGSSFCWIILLPSNETKHPALGIDAAPRSKGKKPLGPTNLGMAFRILQSKTTEIVRKNQHPTF